MVLALGITGYKAGRYPIEHLGTSEYLGWDLKKYSPPKEPFTTANSVSLLTNANVVMMRKDYAISEQFRSELLSKFDNVNNWKDDIALYYRRLR